MTAWSRERPTKEGWWWWRVDEHDICPWMVRVSRGDFGLMLMSGPMGHGFMPIGEGGEWQGPLEPKE